ncbi:MAG: hypothetical protein JEZ06_23015 [Anaerolineaceae bacterium]|nr:hypothetical protein [Anaerolineaceae bacterium]
MRQIFIGIDDTDNLESRGTGHLARLIADHLRKRFYVSGVTRHQLLFDPRVPYTAKNSCAAIHLKTDADVDLDVLEADIARLMLGKFNPGSDPGLCITQEVPEKITAFGRKAQTDLVSQAEARSLASENNIRLQGLGGTEDGVIGALAAVGLASSGEDGRYVQVGSIRELMGLQSVDTVLSCGVSAVRTMDGKDVLQGQIQTEKMRPARRESAPILFVEPIEDYWQPLKLD